MLINPNTLPQVVWWFPGVAAGACSKTRPSCGSGPSRIPWNPAGSIRKEEGCPRCLGATGRCAGSFCVAPNSCTLRTTVRRSWKEPLTSAESSTTSFQQSVRLNQFFWCASLSFGFLCVCREIVDNHEKENALNIVTGERTYHIYAESPEDARYDVYSVK